MSETKKNYYAVKLRSCTDEIIHRYIEELEKQIQSLKEINEDLKYNYEMLEIETKSLRVRLKNGTKTLSNK